MQPKEVAMSAQLNGRSALVTGSTHGIGVAMAQALAGAGAHVVVSGRDASAGLAGNVPPGPRVNSATPAPSA